MNRFGFKPSKCKLLFQNCEPESVKINGHVIDNVDDHGYLGTVVEANGSRRKDMKTRVKDCSGVLNEIVEVSKVPGLSTVRLQYIEMFTNACFISKFKHGCEVWDTFNKSMRTLINKLIPDMMKRVLEVPQSTPALAVQHELGFVDMDLEVEMERILLYYAVEEMDDKRIVKPLFKSMFDKNVPGFCSAVNNAITIFNLKENPIDIEDKRKDLKTRMVQIQRDRILKAMLISSKCNGLILNFDYDGKMKRYMKVLPFKEAQIIFLYRARMFPTKDNFKGRWAISCLCSYCCGNETDEHLFKCCGYLDLVKGNINHISLMKLDSDDETLKQYAQVLLQIYSRIMIGRNDKELNETN